MKSRQNVHLIKFSSGRRLLRTDSPGLNIGLEVILTANGDARHSPEYGKLADMRKRVDNRSLKEFLGWGLQWMLRGEVAIELLERPEETIDAILPRKRRGVSGLAFAIGERERPIQQVC